jgi:hypothetical protein
MCSQNQPSIIPDAAGVLDKLSTRSCGWSSTTLLSGDWDCSDGDGDISSLRTAVPAAEGKVAEEEQTGLSLMRQPCSDRKTSEAPTVH